MASSSFHTFRRVGIVSSAQTNWRHSWSQAQHIDLISSAVIKALNGSGLRIEDVDFVIDSGSDVLDGRSISNCGFLGAMGAHHKEESRVEDDGLWAAQYGVNKIASGSATASFVNGNLVYDNGHFNEKNYGKRGTIARDELESGYEAFLAWLRRNNRKK